MRFHINKKIAAITHKPTFRKMKCAIHLLDVKPCSEAHLTYQAGFLTYGYQRLSSPSHMYDWVMQWDFENRLSEYSDRIAQGSHLIPFSHLLYGRYALGTAFSAHY